MASNSEHANEEQLCRSVEVEANLRDREEAGPLREERTSPVTVRRHLYVVHRSDLPPKLNPAIMKPPPVPCGIEPGAMLGRSVQAQIGRMLRDAFSDVADEPVPRRFIALIEALEDKEKQW